MRILVVQPGQLHLTAHAAADQDQVALISQLKRQGNEVVVLNRTPSHIPSKDMQSFLHSLGVRAEVVQSHYPRLSFARLRNLGYLDGAAWQYSEPLFLNRIDGLLSEFDPELVWCHFSFCWPAALCASTKGIPTVVRSVYYAPTHYLQEHQTSDGLTKWPRYIGKLISERRALSASTVLAAITPDEEQIYQDMSDSAKVKLLPLLSLQNMFENTHETNSIRHHSVTRVVLMGASYRIQHNLRALDFLVTKLIPIVRAKCPGKFRFYVVGTKVPDELLALRADDLQFEGYVPDLDSMMQQVDVAIAPWISGGGMQQKLFEPLCRGIATITHTHALAGYPFVDDKHVLLADSAEEFAAQLIRLLDNPLRVRIGQRGRERAKTLFGPKQMNAYLEEILRTACQ